MTIQPEPGIAPPVPPLRAGDPPLAILVDYDGTIAQTDVSDTVMAEYVSGEWEAEVAAYDAGTLGSRNLMTLEMAMVDSDPADLFATAAAQPHDAGFAPFAARAQAAGIPVEIVSDGFGFFIEPAMVALGVPDLPIVTARTTFRGRRAEIAYPNGNPYCLVCGTCKRDRVLAHRAAGRRVVFIGDGESDRYAAGYSDVVFAKRSLVRICLEAGWPFHRWTEFQRDRGVAGRSPGDVARRPDEPRAAPRRRPAAQRVLLWRAGLGRGPDRPASRGCGRRRAASRAEIERTARIAASGRVSRPVRGGRAEGRKAWIGRWSNVHSAVIGKRTRRLPGPWPATCT